MNALLRMRRNSKQKELEALLGGEHDSCPCYIEVNFTLLFCPYISCFAVLWVFSISCQICKEYLLFGLVSSELVFLLTRCMMGFH